MSSRVAALVAGESVEVLGLDARSTLAMVVGERRRAEEAAARELKAVTHWCDLHAAGEGVVGAVDRSLLVATPGEPLLGREGVLRLAGQGAFMVEEFAVAELATALGMSESAARGYVAEALELRERLPRLWGQVHAGLVPVWKARRVAEETIPLNPACADHVDRQLAPFAGRLSLRRILRAVHAAVARHDPALARERARTAAEDRGVWLGPDEDGTTVLTARTTTPDALAFDAAVTDVAATLAALGDDDVDQLRRAKAIGILADPQHALDLHATLDAHAEDPTGARRPRRTTGTGPGAAPVFHLHLHADAFTDALPAGEGPVVRVERHRPLPLAAVETWLSQLAPGAVVKLTPVVDLREHLSVDAYEAPERLRSQVEHRDSCCVFPWCGREGRFDLDHLIPYVPLDEGGPPGQTSTTNLARLCRFHHRVKTHPGQHGRWDCSRRPDGTLTWTSPLGRVYAVDHTGTRSRGRRE